MKKKIIFILSIILLFGFKVSAVSAENSISLLLNDAPIYSDVEPEIINSRTMVPLAIIGRTLNAEVNWENDTRKVEIIKSPDKVTLFIDNPNLYFTGNDARIEKLDTAPYIKNGRTMVPLRALAEIFGLNVDWDNGERRVVMTTDSLKLENPESILPEEEISSISENSELDNEEEFIPYYLINNEENKTGFIPRYLPQNKDKYEDKYKEETPKFYSKYSGKPTLKFMLQNAMIPAGRVLYVYGGAWNEEDTGSGIEARSFGLSPTWSEFFYKQSENYDASKHSYEIHGGLDCSGFLAWTMYNTFRKEDKSDYLVNSTKMAKNYAERGWGFFTPREEVNIHRPGDIMSTNGHVWLSLGQCDDGSVLLVHASPPGVKLSGTMTPDGNRESEAHLLAMEYMKKYRKEFMDKFPNMYPNKLGYLKEYDRFTWDLSPRGVISDPDDIYNMKPREVLKVLFEE